MKGDFLREVRTFLLVTSCPYFLGHFYFLHFYLYFLLLVVDDHNGMLACYTVTERVKIAVRSFPQGLFFSCFSRI